MPGFSPAQYLTARIQTPGYPAIAIATLVNTLVLIEDYCQPMIAHFAQDACFVRIYMHKHTVRQSSLSHKC